MEKNQLKYVHSGAPLEPEEAKAVASESVEVMVAGCTSSGFTTPNENSGR